MAEAKTPSPAAGRFSPKVLAAWAFVGVPLAWAVWQVVVKALALFSGAI